MTMIRMLKTEPVSTPTGSMYLYAGNDYSDLSEENAQSLVGRGLAVEVTVIDNVKVDRSLLEKKPLRELRILAKERGIEDASLLTKEILLGILVPDLVIEGTVM